jgi:hypothetical protein
MNGIEERRQQETWRPFGRRRSDKAKIMFVVNILAAILMVTIGYLIR